MNTGTQLLTGASLNVLFDAAPGARAFSSTVPACTPTYITPAEPAKNTTDREFEQTCGARRLFHKLNTHGGLIQERAKNVVASLLALR